VAGRPTKLPTDEAELTRLEQLIRAGATGEVAAQAVGVDPSTFDLWLQKGRNGVQPYRDFSERVARARAESEAGLVARIASVAGKGSWQAAAWLLERRFPERWGKPGETPKPEPTVAASEKAFAEVIDLAKRRPS
jgi:transposase